MRYRKAVRKQKARVTLGEDEIIEACYDYVKKKGITPGNLSWLIVPKGEEKRDSLGRRRRIKVQFMVEYDD